MVNNQLHVLPCWFTLFVSIHAWPSELYSSQPLLPKWWGLVFLKRTAISSLDKRELETSSTANKTRESKAHLKQWKNIFQNKYMMLNMGCHRIVGWLLFQKTLFPIPNLFKHDTMNTNYLFKHGMSLLLLGIFLLYHMRQSWDGQGDVFTMAVGLYWIPP